MGEHEIAPLAASQMMAWAAVVSAAAAAVAAVGIWVFGIGMMRSNARRADTEKNRHDQIMAAFEGAAKDREAAIAAAAEDRKAIAAQMAHQAEQAAEDRKAIAAQIKRSKRPKPARRRKSKRPKTARKRPKPARQAEQAAEARKAAQEQAAEDRKEAEKDRNAITSLAQATLQAAQKSKEDQEATQALLKGLQDQGKALEEILRRTDPDNGNGNVTPISKRTGPAK